jgi:hypothetical protein
VAKSWGTDQHGRSDGSRRGYDSRRRISTPWGIGPTTLPLALAQFPDDIQAIRAYAERDHTNIRSWNIYGRGGHYAAHQAPDLLVDDIRQFYSRQVPDRPIST